MGDQLCCDRMAEVVRVDRVGRQRAPVIQLFAVLRLQRLLIADDRQIVPLGDRQVQILTVGTILIHHHH